MATVVDLPEPETLATADPDSLYEVIGTEIVEKAPMGAFEYRLAFVLGVALENFAAANRLGQAQVEMLFNLRPAVDRDRRPDVSFVSAARWPPGRLVSKTAAWRVVPDLAVEVVSPSNSATAVLGKVGEYFRAGVSLVWVIFPDHRQVYVYESPTALRVLADGDDLDGGIVLPGFRLGVSDLFGEPEEPGA